MKILDIIKNLGPAVASALAVPTGGISLGVLGLVKSITGSDDAEIAEEILKNNPEKLADFELKLKELAITEQAALLADRKDARAMNVAMQTTSQAWVQPALAFLAVFGFFGVIGALLFGVPGLDGTARDILLMLIGVLSVLVKDVYGFFFGSSKGSQDKDARAR